MMHPTIPAEMPQKQMAAKLRAALAHMFPLNAMRITHDGECIVIEDDEGNEWFVEVHQ